MSSDLWKKARLGDIADVVMGQSPKSEYYNNTGQGLPFLQGNRTFGYKHPVFDTYCTNGNKFANPDDVLLSVRAPVGDLNITKERVCIGRGLASICMKNGNNEYLYYLLKANIDELINRQSGTVYGSINRNDIINLEVLVVDSDEEQLGVSDILSTLDDKIELNRATNVTLEAIAQAIFKEWFVDFNYPGATGEMVDSELGPIPKGWSVKPLDEIANFLNGLALQKYPPENENDYLPVIKIRELRNGVTETSDRASRRLPKEYVVEDGDLLFSWSGSLEVKFWVGGEGALNQHLFKVTSENYPLWFCYHWILHHLQEFRDIAEEKTTTMGHIKREHLSKALCSVPDSPGTVEGLLSLLHKKMMILNEETNTLINICNSLLPKLLRPKIRE